MTRPPPLLARTMAVTFVTVAINRHLALGARILRQVAFLAPHLPIVELQVHAGTQFDAVSVDALVAALPAASHAAEPALQELLGRAHA